MAELERLLQRLEADTSQFNAALRDAREQLNRTDRATEQTASGIRTRFAAARASVLNLRNAFVALGGALAVRQVLSYADAYTRVQNQLRVTGTSTGELAERTTQLFDIATRTRTPIEAIAQLYGRASIAASELGITQEELLGFVETTGQALAVQGTSAEAASGALLQLAQALGSGIVRAEEFNSILEGAFPLAQAAARGIQEAGGSVARLRQLIAEGEITSREFFDGIRRGSGEIAEAFGESQITVGQALGNIRTAMIELVGGTDSAAGGTRRLAEAIQGVADAMRDPVFQTFARDLATDLVSGFGDAIAVVQELNEWVGRLTGGMFDLADAISLPAQQFALMVDAIARLFGATPAPDTSLEALAPPEVVERIRRMRDELSALGAGGGKPLVVDIHGGQPPPPQPEEPPEPPEPRIIPPAPMSREEAQTFNLPIESTHVGGAAAFADDLEELRRKAQEVGFPDAERLAELRAEADAFAPMLDLLAENANRFSEALASGLARAALSGESLSTVLERIGLQIAEFALSSVIGAAIGQAPVGGEGGSGLLGLVFGGGRQHGGPVDPFRAFLVGERGPELFVPNTAGMIVPSGAAASGRVDVDARPQITVVDQRSAGAPPVQVRQRTGIDGRPVVDILVADSLDRMHSSGQLDRMLAGRRGVRRS